MCECGILLKKETEHVNERVRHVLLLYVNVTDRKKHSTYYSRFLV